MPDRISLVHTADLHLGRSFLDLGAKGSHLRRRLLEALPGIADLARDRNCGLVLIAGDLFDSPHPGKEALAALARFFARVSESGAHCAVIPGTHDPAGAAAFAGPPFTSENPLLHLLTPERPYCLIPELDLAVGAWFPARDRAREWIGPKPGWHQARKFRVVMAHGSALAGLGDDGPEELIPAAVLGDPEVHYLALGHHHGFKMAARGPVPAYYSGAPEMLAGDQREAGHVAHVVLTATAGGVEAEVQAVRVGKLRGQKVEVAVAELQSADGLEGVLERLRDPDLCLEVIVSGEVPAGTWLPDPREIEDQYADAFFKLKVRDRAVRGLPGAAAAGAPAGSVLAEFVRRAQSRIESSSGPEREEWEEALRLGASYLGGGGRQP